MVEVDGETTLHRLQPGKARQLRQTGATVYGESPSYPANSVGARERGDLALIGRIARSYPQIAGYDLTAGQGANVFVGEDHRRYGTLCARR